MTAPEFSVIIPAFNVLGYLRQAVMSVASDSGTQVIVVDDRSTDWTASLADELESLYPSVRVIRPDANVGLGRARNLGLEHARGEYIVFLDGDDYLVEGAIDRLREAVAQSPDVVIYGYKRLYPNGDAHEGVQRAPLQVPGEFTAVEQPAILDVLNVAWNKAYRREFLVELGVGFPVGYYEDIPWTYPILVKAQSIHAIDEPLYMYRQRWSGSILRSTDARHLEIVDQFERLMKVLDTLEVDPAMQGEVYTRAFRNLVTLATSHRSRVPKNLRRDYYTRVRKSVRAYRPEGYELPTSGDKWKLMRTMWLLGYSSFTVRQAVAEFVRRMIRSVRRGPRSIIRTLRTLRRARWTYLTHRRFMSVDSKMVVMENLWGLSPRLNCLAVDAELRRTHPDMRIVWSVKPDQAPFVPAGIDYVAKGSRAYFRVLARAKYFFLDTNLPGWWRKRAGQVFTQLHHGTPLKLMGVEERGPNRSWMNGLLRRSQNWDFSVVSSPYCAEVWQHSYPVRCETLAYGYPRNDVLVNADQSVVAEARTRLGLEEGTKAVLYMPTFREREQNNVAVSDLNTIASALDPGDVLLVRGHYFANYQSEDDLHPAVRDVTGYEAVEDLYLAADVLATDYSSAMFDFAILGRPIIIFAHDWEEYREQRGTYFDITTDSPGQVVRTAEEFGETLASGSYSSQENQDRLRRFTQRFAAYETGHAASDIIARVIDGKRKDHDVQVNTPPLTTWNMERLA